MPNALRPEPGLKQGDVLEFDETVPYIKARMQAKNTQPLSPLKHKEIHDCFLDTNLLLYATSCDPSEEVRRLKSQ